MKSVQGMLNSGQLNSKNVSYRFSTVIEEAFGGFVFTVQLFAVRCALINRVMFN